MNNLFSVLPVLSSAQYKMLSSAVTAFCILLGVVAVIAVVLEIIRAHSHYQEQKRTLRILTIPVYILALVLLVFTIYCGDRMNYIENSDDPSMNSTPSTPSVPSTPSNPDSQPSSVPSVPSQPPTVPAPTFPAAPHSTNNSNPSNWNVTWEIFQGSTPVDRYQRPISICFTQPENYFALPGIAGFRGDNYRTGSTYGSVNVVDKALKEVWQQEISSLPKGSSGVWSGVGWTGQPLIVQWDEETKAIMNLKPEKKAKKDLVEVIYATLDGHIYFYDLEDGEYTRDPLYVGMAFKGSGSLDPRGYPIMYVGSGDRTNTRKEPRMFIISLIDCTILYQYGHESGINIRSWRAFDASPLVDAETDTLIWPGENGLIYTFKLNTQYDKAAGKLSINPDAPVINRYMTDLNKDDPGNNLGFEASPIIVDNYLYVGDNRGIFFCIDLNTMGLVWAQEIRDDLNATPVFEWGDDGQGYLYLGTSMEYAEGTCYVYKLNAATGEIVWQKTYDNVFYDKNVSGGVLSSPLLGKKGTALEGMIIFNIAKTPGQYNGIMVALNTKTGEEVWRKAFNHYCWSSPAAVYSDDGRAYIVQFDSGGYAFLLDARNGAELSKISVGTNVEASPAIFNNMLVVGTRGEKVFGIRID